MDSLAGYGVLISVLLISSWLYPAVAIGGILCLFGLDQWASSTSTFFVGKESLTNILFGFSVLLSNIKLVYKQGLPSVFYTKIGWLVIALYLYVFMSISWAPNSEVGKANWSAVLPYIITMVLLIPLILRTLSDIHQALSFLIIFGGLIVVLVLFYTDWDSRGIVVYDKYGDESTSNPLAISGMAGYISLACIFGRQWDSMIWNKLKWVLVGICFTLILKTGSRGQLFSLLIIIFVMWPFVYKLKSVQNFILSGFIIILIYYVIEWGLAEYWSEGDRWSGDKMSEDMDERYHNAKMLLTAWWTGGLNTLIFGLGNSASYDTHITDWGMYPHMVMLEVIGEEGLIGISIYLTILYMIFIKFIKGYQLSNGFTRVQGSLIALSSMLLYAFILSFKQGSFLGNLTLSMMYILMAKYLDIIEYQSRISGVHIKHYNEKHV